MTEKTKPAQSDEKILEEARSRFKEANDADSDNRKQALDDLKFAWNFNDYQWDETAKKVRKGRPCLTENRIPQFIRQIVNAQRQNRPSITVAPADGKANPQVAEVTEGMIRHIEQWSKADLAYDNSFEAAVSSSVGYFRITTEYVDDNGFDQDLCIRPIDNPFSVYDDPHYQLPDGSDRKYCFVTEWVNRDDFEAEHGFKPKPWGEDGTDGDDELWYEEKRVRVAEYWRLRIEKTKLKTEAYQGKAKEREVCKKIVEQFLLTGDKVIRKSEWLGVYIPIIPVFGEVKNVEGKKLRKSLIRDVKDAQRMTNYFVSAEVESVALQPKAPFIGATGSFETDAEKWATANTDNHAYLQYDPVENGSPPVRQPPPDFPAALRETRMGFIESMKSIMGIYDASLGARSNETSGVAIDARAKQSDNATYHYLDNMTRAIRYAGLVIIDLLPKVYDQPRVVRILKPDGEAHMAAINQLFIDPTTMQEQQINLQDGRYDVVVKAGPSFQTARQEAQQYLTELIKAYPPFAQMAGDLLFKNMDFVGAEEIAKRLAPKGEQIPPQVQQQMEQMKQMIQQGQAYIQKLEHEKKQDELKLAGKDLDLKAKDIALKDKGEANAINAGKTVDEHKRFVIETIIEFLRLDMQGKQADMAAQQSHMSMQNDNEQSAIARDDANQNRAIDRAQAMEAETEKLVS